MSILLAILLFQSPTVYILGPQDEVTIRVLDAEEIPAAPIRLDMEGYIKLPMAGRVKAGGLTVQELEVELARRLKEFLVEPQVTVSVASFRSQPVSVLGSVKQPGVYQVEGRKSLFEVLSLAGGLAPDAGYTIKLTRRAEWGRIPLVTAVAGADGRFYTAEVPVRSIMEARNPEENILICPNDVISVPRGQLVYVIGAVRKSGGFILADNETISILQALSLAEGVAPMAAPASAKILRTTPGSSARTEIPVDVKKIFEGKSSDVPLGPEDILFIPTSKAKNAALRAIETGIGLGSGIILWRSRGY